MSVYQICRQQSSKNSMFIAEAYLSYVLFGDLHSYCIV